MQPQQQHAIPQQTFMKVLCCMCGIPMDSPNPSNTCANCLASKSDVSRGISTEATLHQCRGCQRWHKEAGKWIACELESRELMALCLANVSGLQKNKNATNGRGRVRVVDASWIWTEPHSMRLKVRLTVQKEVETGTILQQSFTVVFVVRNQQCVECQAEFRQGSWKSLVQVRQRVGHKRTFLYLEQLILKHGAHRGCLSIETFRDGMDFYFPEKGKAARFMSFLENVVPVRVKSSKKLIGTDDKSNIANFKYTNLVEICPLCKDDLLYLPAKAARRMGNISRVVLVKNISNLIHVVDPLSGQVGSMDADQYWRDPIRPIVTAARSRFARCIVLGKEPVVLSRNVSKRSATRKQRNRLAMVTIAKEDDLGVNDRQVEERSHVGYLLKSGDVCLAYDLKETQLVDDDAEEARSSGRMPDVVVVRKLYGGVATGEANPSRMRKFRLERLDVEVAEDLKSSRAKKNAELDDMDEEDFLREVEADREMRNNMNLYKSALLVKRSRASQDNAMDEDQDNEDDEDEDEDDQEVKLDELLDGLVLNSEPDDVEETQDSFAPFLEGEKAAKDGIAYVSQEQARELKDKDTARPVVGNVFGQEYMNTKFKFI